jgi:hypothetical protein
MAQPAGAEMSVVVTVVDGGETLVRCLEALSKQVNAPRLDVIIPYDDTAADVGKLAARYPAFRFLDLGRLLACPPRNEFERHDLYDRRRAGGLKESSAPLIAMIEDRGAPEPDWANAMVCAHARYEDGVIGGSVENRPSDLARWAIFFVDFSRYQAPFDNLHPEYVTDTNICYKRAALEAARPVWNDKYQEAAVNWALREKGFSLRVDPAPRTVQARGPIGLRAMASERFNWGRVYGEQRARDAPIGARLRWMSITPLLPVVLYLRHFGKQLRVRRHVGEFLAATPIVLFLLTFWAIGEFRGYLDAGKR